MSTLLETSVRNSDYQPRLPAGASVKLIGLGGVGAIVARYGAMFLGSLSTEARLVLIEGDDFEPGNSDRMLFRTCGNKASVIREELLPHFQETSLSLMAVESFVTPENIAQLIQEEDIVLLTVDNHATRHLVDTHCSQLHDVCLISGGNDGVGPDARGKMLHGTYGNVQVFLRRGGQDLTPSLGQFHPEISHPGDKLPTELHCVDLMKSVPQVLFANLTVASCILNTLWLYLCGALKYPELAFDIAQGLMRPVPLPMAGLKKHGGQDVQRS